MPFTLSHTIAGYPFYKFSQHKIPLMPLAIGCMSPDFSYFLEDLFLSIGPCHSLKAGFTKCLPVSLVVLFLIYFYRYQATYFIPSKQVREFFVSELESLKLKNVFLIILGILIGTWTHLFWDAWTHKSGVFVQWLQFDWYRVIQHLSTVLGFGFMIYKFKKMKATIEIDKRLWVLGSILAVSITAGSLTHHHFPGRTVSFEIISCSIAYMSCLFLLTLICMKASKFSIAKEI